MMSDSQPMADDECAGRWEIEGDEKQQYTLSRSKSKLSFEHVEPPASIATSHGEWCYDGGVSKVAFCTYMLCAFWTVGSFPFVANGLIYLLEQKFSGTYSSDQCRSYLSLFVVFDQAISIVTSPLWAFLSEKLGRRRCYSVGLATIATAIGIFPAAACIFPTTVGKFFGSLLFFRLIYGIGAACCSVMFSTVMTDYCENNRKSQGKLAAMAGLSAGFGALASVAGLTYIGSHKHAYLMCFITCGLIGFSSVLCFLFMRDAPRRIEKGLSFGRNLAKGFTKLSVPSISIACMSVFLCRGNNLIPLAFVKRRALRNAFSAVSLLGMCIFGYLARKFNHFKLLMVSSLMLIFGFVGMETIGQVVVGCISACLAGVGQGGLTVTGMALLSGSVKMEERSALSSTFNLFGNLGILTAALLGYVCTETNNKYRFGIYISSLINMAFFWIVLWVSIFKDSMKALSSDKSSIGL